MSFARWLFRIAGIWGLAVLIPLYFAPPGPPALTHAHYYYGFIGSAGAMQLVYLLIATDPPRYRPLMLLGTVGKLSFVVPALLAYAGQRAGDDMLVAGVVDGALALLFLLAWWRIGSPRPHAEAGQSRSSTNIAE